MLEHLEKAEAKYAELGARMAEPEVLGNPEILAKIAAAHSELMPLIEAARSYRAALKQIADAEELLQTEDDPEMRELAEEERAAGTEQRNALDEQITLLLLPKDEFDERNIILEIRAGTGGDEAALFVSDLYRMYTRYAELQRWKLEELSRHETGIGGLKEVIATVSGRNVYSRMKFEGGVHRVQRVPETESSGRVHTSAVTVAVLPEAEAVDIVIPDSELQVDVYRSSGPGGQSVNTTDSAVRLTHLPTGTVVTCQDEKSQHKNRAKALKVMRARLLAVAQEAQAAERAATRRSMVGTGDRSQRIRTYNFPENRVTDHRIKLTLYRLAQIIEGDLGEVTDALTLADQEAKMAAL